MDAVILAAGGGTRVYPLTNDGPKGMVVVDGRPILADCFEQLRSLGPTAFHVVGYREETVISRFGDEYAGVPITYAHQREQAGLVHALLTVEDRIDAIPIDGWRIDIAYPED